MHFFNKNGVITTDCRDERPGLMIIGSDPEDITTSDLIATTLSRSFHAELMASNTFNTIRSGSEDTLSNIRNDSSLTSLFLIASHLQLVAFTQRR